MICLQTRVRFLMYYTRYWTGAGGGKHKDRFRRKPGSKVPRFPVILLSVHVYMCLVCIFHICV